MIRHWNGDAQYPPVLIGEDNPYGGSPRNALFPAPANSAGHRLCVKIFGMDPRQYLLAFLRYNLCAGKWNPGEALRRAEGLRHLYAHNPKILLGRKVATAWGLRDFPAFRRSGDVLVLPHPSGRCREWNDPKSYERARDALEDLLK